MLWHHFAIRLGLALVLGAFIGAERQWRQGMTRDSIRAQHCGVRQRLERCLLIASEEAENGQDNRVVHPEYMRILRKNRPSLRLSNPTGETHRASIRQP